MLDQLPILINPVSFCERGKELEGTLKISELTRLSDSLLDNSGVVEVKFSFDKEGRVPTIRGEIKANLVLECQSCLDEVVCPVDKKIKLGVVLNMEQADRLTSDCEPLVLTDEKISLVDLVEDELLLALPDFPRHQYECAELNDGEAVVAIESDQTEQVNSNNPFSVLAKLKNTGD